MLLLVKARHYIVLSDPEEQVNILTAIFSPFNLGSLKSRHYLLKFFRKQFQVQQRISKENINNERGAIPVTVKARWQAEGAHFLVCVCFVFFF